MEDSKRIGKLHNQPGESPRSILRKSLKISHTDHTLSSQSNLLPIGSGVQLYVEPKKKEEENNTETSLKSSRLVLSDDYVYAMQNFVASLEGQVCVLKGDLLCLLDDSNSYWWLVRCMKTNEVGFIPADNIETQSEYLARMNKMKNVKIAAPSETDILKNANRNLEVMNQIRQNPIIGLQEPALSPEGKKNVQFFNQVISIRHSDDDVSSMNEENEESSNEESKMNQSGFSSVLKWLRESYTTKKTSLPELFDSDREELSESETEQEDGEEKKVKKVKKRRALSWYSKQKSETDIDPTSLDPEFAKQKEEEEKEKKKTTFQSKRISFFYNKRKRVWSESIPKEEERPQRRNSEPTSVSSTSLISASGNTTPSKESSLMVIKVFGGNYDFKATYKTVAVTNETKVSDVLRLALVRFRVPGFSSKHKEISSDDQQKQQITNSLNQIGTSLPDEKTLLSQEQVHFPVLQKGIDTEKEYYISVVHGDSKEKKLNANDSILEILFKLQSKSIRPGIAPSSQKEIIKHLQTVTEKGVISKIRTPNDSEIKFLLNKRKEEEISQDHLAEKFLIRIFYFGDDFGTGTLLQTSKTLGVRKEMSVHDVIQESILKFKIHKAAGNGKQDLDLVKSFSLYHAKEKNYLNNGDALHLDAIIDFSQIKTLIQADGEPISPETKIEKVAQSILNSDSLDFNLSEGFSFVLQKNQMNEQKEEKEEELPSIRISSASSNSIPSEVKELQPTDMPIIQKSKMLQEMDSDSKTSSLDTTMTSTMIASMDGLTLTDKSKPSSISLNSNEEKSNEMLNDILSSYSEEVVTQPDPQQQEDSTSKISNSDSTVTSIEQVEYLNNYLGKSSNSTISLASSSSKGSTTNFNNKTFGGVVRASKQRSQSISFTEFSSSRGSVDYNNRTNPKIYE